MNADNRMVYSYILIVGTMYLNVKHIFLTSYIIDNFKFYYYGISKHLLKILKNIITYFQNYRVHKAFHFQQQY